MKTLYVAWQDSATRQWYPVGRLDRKGGGYSFVYTKAVEKASAFRPFGGMPDVEVEYYSDLLFPIFVNRTLPKTRPEYAKYLNWLGINSSQDDLMLELSRSFGAKATDTLEIFPLPEPTEEGMYEVYFFSRGHKYFVQDDSATQIAMEKSNHLFLMQDIQNKNDPYAFMLRTDDPVSLVGYIPRYFTRDISTLIQLNGSDSVKVEIERVNYDAPTHYRYLCRLSAKWPESFKPFSSEEYISYND